MVKRLPVALRAVVYMTGFLLFFAWLALRGRSLGRFLQVPLPGGVEILGILLMVCGGALGLACVGTFNVRGDGHAGTLRRSLGIRRRRPPIATCATRCMWANCFRSSALASTSARFQFCLWLCCFF